MPASLIKNIVAKVVEFERLAITSKLPWGFVSRRPSSTTASRVSTARIPASSTARPVSTSRTTARLLSALLGVCFAVFSHSIAIGGNGGFIMRQVAITKTMPFLTTVEPGSQQEWLEMQLEQDLESSDQRMTDDGKQ